MDPSVGDRISKETVRPNRFFCSLIIITLVAQFFVAASAAVVWSLTLLLCTLFLWITFCYSTRSFSPDSWTSLMFALWLLTLTDDRPDLFTEPRRFLRLIKCQEQVSIHFPGRCQPSSFHVSPTIRYTKLNLWRNNNSANRSLLNHKHNWFLTRPWTFW